MPVSPPVAGLSQDDIAWLEWFYACEPLDVAHNESRWIERAIRTSPASEPLLRAEVLGGDQAAAGFAILARGAMAVHGRSALRPASSFHTLPKSTTPGIRSERPSPYPTTTLSPQPAPNTRPVPNIKPASNIDTNELLDAANKLLVAQAFHRGAEIYHSLTPVSLPTTTLTPVNLASCVPPAENKSCLRFITTLLRFENLNPAETLDKIPASKLPPNSSGTLCFEPYRKLPFHHWCSLIRDAYRESLDVPEIEGVRSIEQTLEGYAVNQPSNTDAWFAISINQSLAGCLILSIPSRRQAEITYLGLHPQFRSKGYGFEIMRFALQWMSEQNIEIASLSVDCRNTPAIQLYQRFDFNPTEAYHAWATTPQWFAATLNTTTQSQLP
jgi:ribosomal protein S18 acetylase RimI-like enzyme